MAQIATDRVMQGASQLEKIGFVDFTVSLVKGVYETIVQASIEQLNSYAELVNKVSKDLSAYQADMIGADGSPEIQSKIESYIKDVLSLDPAATNDYKLSEQQANDLKNNLANTNVVDESTTPPKNKTIIDFMSPVSGSTDFTLKVGDLKSLIEIKLKDSVKNSQDLLKTILKIGMQKVVVTNGEIMTKLTFHVDAQDTSTSESNKSNEKASSWGIGGGISGGVGGIGKLLGASVNAKLSGGYSNKKMSVSVVNEKSSSATNIQIDILGQVKILFRTETFPTVDA